MSVEATRNSNTQAVSLHQAGTISRIISWFTPERLLWSVLAVFVIAISIVPLVYAIDAAFYEESRVGLTGNRSLDAVLTVYGTAEYLGYFGSALLLSGVVTALSLVFGVLAALIVARTDIPKRGLMDLLIIMPMFVSPFTGLIAWVSLGSERTGFINVLWVQFWNLFGISAQPLFTIWSFGGVVWVMFLFFCPFVYLFTVGSMRSMDSSLEEAARTSGAGPIQTLLKITVPMSMPSIFSAGLLVFILAAELYTIPGIIGANAGFTTLPWKIYEDSTQFPVHRAHAAAGGTMILWIALIGMLLQRHITKRTERFVTTSGKGFKGQPLPLGRWKWAALAVLGIYVLCADILPMGAILLSSFMKFSSATITPELLTVQHYQTIFQLPDLRSATMNTLILAVLSGGACVVLGFLISFLEVRRPTFGSRLLSIMGILPVAVPGMIYAIGLLWLYLRTPLYGSIWILLLAIVAKFLPYGILVSRSGIMQVHPELEQSARMSGASPLLAIRAIVMPLVKPTLIALLFFVMLQSFKELSASALLYGQNSLTLSVLTWHYMDGGEYQFAAAVGVIQTILMIGLVMVTRAIFKVKLEAVAASK
jgi:iron(III) transport system permease protein